MRSVGSAFGALASVVVALTAVGQPNSAQATLMGFDFQGTGGVSLLSLFDPFQVPNFIIYVTPEGTTTTGVYTPSSLILNVGESQFASSGGMITETVNESDRYQILGVFMGMSLTEPLTYTVTFVDIGDGFVPTLGIYTDTISSEGGPIEAPSRRTAARRSN